MKFKKKLIQGEFLKRYKRFFADVKLDDQIVVAHVPNTGSMKSVNNPGQACLLSLAENPDRKLKYTLEAIQCPLSQAWVGVNTSWPNKLVRLAFENGEIKDWKKYSEIQSEVKINKETRLDILLTDARGNKKYIEIKNVSLRVGPAALFPDSVTERGQKHLRELMALVDEGHQAEIVYFIQRNDCAHFSPADEIDPEYGRLLRAAVKKGVIVRPLVYEFSEDGLVFQSVELKVVL